MTEIVELESEKWISELEQMQRINLFNTDEIRVITKKRKEFLYRINRRTKNKKDYLRYIEFEKDLLNLIELKRKRTGNLTKKNAIDYSIASRINHLYKKVINRFKSDQQLWIDHIEFCKQVNFKVCINHMLIKMLQVHDKPELWKFAARWEFRESKSIVNGRKFLLRGLRFHPESELLYAEAIKLELDYQKYNERKILKQKDITIDYAKLCMFADVFLNESIQKIQNVHFFIKLINITENYSFTKPLTEKIFNHLVENFAKEELTWHVKARQNINEILSKKDYDIEMCDELESQINVCCEVYEEALKEHPSEKLWSLYIETLNELAVILEPLKTFIENTLISVLFRGHKAAMLEESAYIQLDDILKAKNKAYKLVKILSEATSKYPNSAKLWFRRLHILHVHKKQIQESQEVFTQASKHLSDENDLITLWKMRLAYIKDDSEMEYIFREGINLQHSKVVSEIRPQFLEWICEKKGISACRKEFKNLVLLPPLTFSLFSSMISIEESQNPQSSKQIRKIYNTASNFYGTSLELWLNYIKFEYHCKESSDLPAVYDRALKNLKAPQVDELVTQFTLYKLNN